MKLGNLVYEVARDAIELPSGFNKIGFINGDYDDDRDYSSQISFAFNYINLALTRLITGKKTMLKVVKKATDSSGYVEFGDGEVIAVTSDLSPEYKRVAFVNYADGIAVEARYASKIVCVEYRPYIPRFDINDIRRQVLDSSNHLAYEEIEVDLSQYGVTDEMCSYVKEFAKGGLMEYLSPELSQRHVQMAESYFNQLKTRYSDFPQREVEDRYGGGSF